MGGGKGGGGEDHDYRGLTGCPVFSETLRLRGNCVKKVIKLLRAKITMFYLVLGRFAKIENRV